MKSLLSIGLPIMILMGSGLALAGGPDTGANVSGFLMTLEYWGPETRTAYRVGFATEDKATELGLWRKANWLMREYFLTNSITANEAAKLREILEQSRLRNARTVERPKGQGYVIAVSDHEKKYFMPIGFEGRTQEVILELQRVCQQEAATLLNNIVRRLRENVGSKDKQEVDKH